MQLTNRVSHASLIEILTNTMMPPAAEPCTARPNISCSTVFDHPQIADPIENRAMEVSNADLRPQMSAALPQTGVTAALVSKYAEPIQT